MPVSRRLASCAVFALHTRGEPLSRGSRQGRVYWAPVRSSSLRLRARAGRRAGATIGLHSSSQAKRIEAAGVTRGFQEASGDAHAVIPGSFVGEWRRPTHPVSALASTVLLALDVQRDSSGIATLFPPRRRIEASLRSEDRNRRRARDWMSSSEESRPSLSAHAGCRCGRRCLGPPYG